MKRILTILTALSFIAMMMPAVIAEQTSEEPVTLIVEVSGKPMLEQSNDLGMEFSLFSETTGAKSDRVSIMAMHESIQSDIDKKVNSDTEVIYTYTDVFNGFAIEADMSDIEKIKALPNVENVYISETHDYISDPIEDDISLMAEDLVTDSCCDMMNVPYMHENGISGEGQVIAIIDTELDIKHEMFSEMPENPRYSKTEIANIISGGLSAKVSVNQVYYNAKIPYRYNYTGKHADVYSNDSNIIHGTHVAGIAAGKGGILLDGTPFESVAPEAQIVFMGVPNFGSAEILAALEDTVKFGVDAVNCSWGANYAACPSGLKKAFNNIIDSGVPVAISAGNESRGFYNKPVPVEMVSYSAGGYPNDISGVTAVAAAQNSYIWENYYNMKVGEETLKFINGKTGYRFSEAFSSEEVEYVYFGQSDSFGNYDLTGKVAVVEMTNMPLSQKFSQIINAGAVGIIFVFYQDNRNCTISSSSKFPVAIVSLSDGKKLENAETKLLKTINEEVAGRLPAANSGITGFSSWGTDYTLELKPEISAPGGQIYSSVPDDKYAIKSGTSMSAPHIAGAMTLMNEYIVANSSVGGKFEEYTTKQKRQKLIENLMMTTARVQMQNTEKNIPFSPRNQGAGFIDLEAAAKTPVVLTVNGGKPKISLKDRLSNIFTLTFEAYNFSDSDVTYTPSVIVEADDYYTNAGKNYVGGMKLLTSSSSSEPVTISAGQTKEISVTVQLDSDELDEQSKIFTNGFFVDGFVSLTSSDADVPQVGIPFTGFYGDWTEASIFDKPYYDENSMLGRTYLGSGKKCEYYYDQAKILTDSCNILGVNYATDSTAFDSESYAGISPNGDGIYDYLCVLITPLRNSGEAVYTVKDADGNELLKETDESMGKFCRNHYDFTNDNFRDIPDGDYTAEVTSKLIYEGDESETISMKFYIDREFPVVESTSIYEKDGLVYIDVTASDNRHLMSATVYGADKSGKDFKAILPYDASESATLTFDVTDADLSTLTIEVCDYAMNITGAKMPAINVSYVNTVTDGGKTTMELSFSNTSSDDVAGDVIAALYDADGTLKGISVKENEIISQGIENKRFEFDTADYASAKVYIWDSTDAMTPLWDETEITNNTSAPRNLILTGLEEFCLKQSLR